MTRIKLFLPGYVEHRTAGRTYVNSRRRKFIHVERKIRTDERGEYVIYRGERVDVWCKHTRYIGRL